MKKTNISEKLSGALSKTSFALRKHSPEILTAVGVAGVVVSAVLACRATTKASRIMSKAKADIDTIHACEENKDIHEKYSEEDKNKDLA